MADSAFAAAYARFVGDIAKAEAVLRELNGDAAKAEQRLNAMGALTLSMPKAPELYRPRRPKSAT